MLARVVATRTTSRVTETGAYSASLTTTDEGKMYSTRLRSITEVPHYIMARKTRTAAVSGTRYSVSRYSVAHNSV